MQFRLVTGGTHLRLGITLHTSGIIHRHGERAILPDAGNRSTAACGQHPDTIRYFSSLILVHGFHFILFGKDNPLFLLQRI
jgi:hypothetical protein